MENRCIPDLVLEMLQRDPNSFAHDPSEAIIARAERRHQVASPSNGVTGQNDPNYCAVGNVYSVAAPSFDTTGLQRDRYSSTFGHAYPTEAPSYGTTGFQSDPNLFARGPAYSITAPSYGSTNLQRDPNSSTLGHAYFAPTPSYGTNFQTNPNFSALGHAYSVSQPYHGSIDLRRGQNSYVSGPPFSVATSSYATPGFRRNLNSSEIGPSYSVLTPSYETTGFQRDPNSYTHGPDITPYYGYNDFHLHIIVSLERLCTAETWRNLSVTEQSAIKDMLLDFMLHDNSTIIAKQAGQTVRKLALLLITDGNNSWPDLLPCLYQCVSSSTSHNHAKSSAFMIIARLVDQVGETQFSGHMNSIHSVFLKTLTDDKLDLDVRALAMDALASFIRCVSSWREQERVQDLLPGMLKAVTDALSSGAEAVSVGDDYPLKVFIKLAKYEPRFFREQLADVVFTILDLVEAEFLGERARHMGVEFLLTLVEAKEKAPGMVKKLPLFVTRFFAVLLQLLEVDIRDGHAWHSAQTTTDLSWMTLSFRIGEKGLRRLSLALGSNFIAHVSKEWEKRHTEWEKRHTALVALACISQGWSKGLIKNLKQVMHMVLNCFRDPHPRVRWLACWVFDDLLINLAPHVQEQFHNQIYHELVAAMGDRHPRVQLCATRALGNFCLHNKPETLMSHMDGIINKLFVLIKNNQKLIVQEEALRALGGAAQSVKGHVQTYYDTVMPCLITILSNADLKSNVTLGTRAMECISIVGLAVGKEKFSDDAKQIMEVLKPLQGLHMQPDHPTTWDMLKACARICQCMGQEFRSSMSAAIEYLIQFMKLHDEICELDDNDIDRDTVVRDKTLEMKGDVALEERAEACNLLCWYANILKEDFYPWVPEVVPILVPLVKYDKSNHVRKNAVQAIGLMFPCATLDAERRIALGGVRHNIIMALLEAMHEEHATDICATTLYELNKCLQICGPLLHEGLVRDIVNRMEHVIDNSSKRKEKLTQRTKMEDFDDEEAELSKGERGVEASIFCAVCEILRTLIEAFKADFLPFLDDLSSNLLPMLLIEQTTNLERSTAISIFTYVVEVCPEAAVRYYDDCFPLMLDASNDEYPDVRQNALYGLRVWEEYCCSSFKHFIGEALSGIYQVIMHSKARETENESAYDNAVSVLGMICQFHSESIDLSQVIPVWLNCLPIKADLVEAKRVHELLCSMVERSQKELFGPNNEYIPKIVSVFAEVLCSKNDLATEETANRIINALRQLQQTIPTTILLSGMPYLLPQHEMELKSILSLDEDDNQGCSRKYEPT